MYMGTPEFAVGPLQKLLDQQYTICAVVTAPDKPAGRGRKVHMSAVKKFALDHDIPVLQPTNLKSESFQEEIRHFQPDLNIVVAFRMLPKIVWQFPRLGTFNLHASLLPQYRGAAPINWAIINGETQSGVTTFMIDDKIDTGSILLQDTTEISVDDTAGDLYEKLVVQGSELVVQTVSGLLEGALHPKPQINPSDLKEAPKFTRENTKINWSQTGNRIYNQIRGLYPFPVAWSNFRNGNEDMAVKILQATFRKDEHSEEFGKVKTEEKKICVAVPNGWIQIDRIQLPGKKAMKCEDLLNGYRLWDNALML